MFVFFSFSIIFQQVKPSLDRRAEKVLQTFIETTLILCQGETLLEAKPVIQDCGSSL